MARFRGDYDSSMAHAVIETFENLAFMEPMRISLPDTAIANEDMMSCCLLINEPLQGEVRLCMPRSLVRRTTQTIWSLHEEALQEKMLLDTLAELLNTIVGRFLAELLAEEEIFQLGLPEQCSCDEFDGEEQALHWHFSLDGGMFRVVALGESLRNIHGGEQSSSPPAAKEPLSL